LKTLLYLLGETVGWFACILGAAHHRHWLGVLVVTALLGLHLATRAGRSISRILLIVLVSILFGFCFDSFLILCGVYTPARWLIPSPFATIWLMALWGNFSLIVDVPLRWLQEHLAIAAIFGGLFGPAAYVGGQRLGAIRIAEPTSSNIAVLAVAWAIGLALLMVLARLVPGYRSGQKTPGEP
jgi:hypothetical protein